MKKITDFLRDEGISPELIQEVQEFSATHPVKEGLKGRIPVPHFYYYGNPELPKAFLDCSRDFKKRQSGGLEK